MKLQTIVMIEEWKKNILKNQFSPLENKVYSFKSTRK